MKATHAARAEMAQAKREERKRMEREKMLEVSNLQYTYSSVVLSVLSTHLRGPGLSSLAGGDGCVVFHPFSCPGSEYSCLKMFKYGKHKGEF